MNRKTSLYTLHVTFPTRGEAQLFLDRMAGGAQDRYYAPGNGGFVARLGWRATGDRPATATATAMLAGLAVPAELTTGLGAHRRTVAVQDAA